VIPLRLLRQGPGAQAERTPDGYRLNAEVEWLVEGETSQLLEVEKALSPRLVTRLGSVLLLRLGNAVGCIPAGPLGMLRVSSGKWTDGDYASMLDEIAAEAAALPFAAGAASASPFDQDTTAGDIPYHAFVWLRHALLDAPARPLLGALRAIVADPHRKLVHEPKTVPVELASRLTARTIEDAYTGGQPLQRAPAGLGVRGLLPLRIAEGRSVESVDTAENRFVKSFLGDCWQLVARLRQALPQAPRSLVASLSHDLDAVEAALVPIRRAALWQQVGPQTFVPSGSSVLQRRAPYREVLRSNNLLRAAPRVLPLSSEAAARLLEVKDIARLYELWCGFRLLGLLRELLGPPSSVTPISGGLFGATLRQGLHARWPSGVELAINATYTRRSGWNGRSSSVVLRPDFSLAVPAGAGQGLHLFDAKFRVKKPAPQGRPKEEDLLKMHAYRDAIAQARSACVLYPGKMLKRFPDEGTAKHLRDGVGAFPALPGQASAALREHLAGLVALG